jgi:membrane protease YdiL (CAAX protease family)
MGSMNRQRALKILAIVLFAALSNSLLVYFSSRLYAALGLENALLLWDLVQAGGRSLIAFLAIFLFSRFCPEVSEQVRLKLSDLRKRPFLGFSGVRKLVILSSLTVLLAIISTQVVEFHAHLTGAKLPQLNSTETYAEIQDSLLGKKLNEKDNWMLATVKNFAGRAALAISEEFIYRWVILGILLGVLSPAASLAVSSVIFGLAHLIARLHYPTLSEMIILVVPTIIGGLGFGILYLRHGLLLSCVLHTLINCAIAFSGEPIYYVIIFVLYSCLFILAPIVISEALIRKLCKRPMRN